MIKSSTTRSALLLSLLALSPLTRADNIKVTMTVDNSFALFYGTATAATNFVGSDFDWQSVQTYNFSLNAGSYIYVVTSSDLSTAQGFLGQFENTTAGYKFYSNDAQWQVMATGLKAQGGAAPYSGSAGDLALLTAEINDANAGGNPSGGWVGTTAGQANDGFALWGATMPGIDAAARWVWYNSNNSVNPTMGGFDHQEWLTFRIAIAATPDNPVPNPNPGQVPEGGNTLAFASAALVGLHLLRRVLRAR